MLERQHSAHSITLTWSLLSRSFSFTYIHSLIRRMASQENTIAISMLGKGEMVNRNLMTMFLVASGELFIFIQIFIFRLPRLPLPYKKHEKSQNGCQNNRMPEHTPDSFTVFWFAFTIILTMPVQSFACSRCSNIWGRWEEEQERGKNSRRRIL